MTGQPLIRQEDSGLFALNHSLSAALIRLCHPRPPARNAASTSLSSLNVTCDFSAVPAGRPRRISFSPSYNDAASNHSSVSSGASSGSAQVSVISFLFTFICLSHRYNVPRIAARRPDNNHHAAAQFTDTDVPCFAVVAPAINKRIMFAGKALSGIGKIKPALSERFITFLRVKGDLHLINVTTIICNVKEGL